MLFSSCPLTSVVDFYPVLEFPHYVLVFLFFLYALLFLFQQLVLGPWFSFVGERELDPVLDAVIGYVELTLMGENVGCKCKWLKFHIAYE